MFVASISIMRTTVEKERKRLVEEKVKRFLSIFLIFFFFFYFWLLSFADDDFGGEKQRTRTSRRSDGPKEGKDE